LSTVGPVVQWSFGACLEPLPEPKDGHEVVVVLLGRGEIRNADADVVDKSGPWHESPPCVGGPHRFSPKEYRGRLSKLILACTIVLAVDA
jgi:hypothetical protein